MTVTYGSLCTGYEGIGLGLSVLFDLDVRWQAENDKHAAKILTHRFPNVPNLGDITTVDWTTVEPVEVMSAGYPCQPFSHAGKRKGTDDERHIWPHIARAIGVLRPRVVLLENVEGHVSLGLADVIADLAALGYDATWCVVRAADVGAPHNRARLFILAAPNASGERHGSEQDRRSVGRVDGTDEGAAPQRQRPRPEPVDRGAATTADSEGFGRSEGWAEPAGIVRRSHVAKRSDAVPDTKRGGRDGRAPVAGRRAVGRVAASGDREIAWGRYEPAIRRWERITDTSAPRPTQTGERGGQQLAPRFVEWLMGLPAGWVTDVPDLSRNEQLTALGNGVVPQQYAAATRILFELAEVAA